MKNNEHYYLKAQIEQLIIPILEEKLTESQKRDKLSNLLNIQSIKEDEEKRNHRYHWEGTFI